MFGFGKKEKVRIEPEFETQEVSESVEDKNLSDILGAQENDTNITAGVDAVLDDEGEINDERISHEPLDFSSVEEPENAQPSGSDEGNSFENSGNEDFVEKTPYFENASAEEVVPETQEWVDESVSSPSEEPAELDEPSSYAESTENNFSGGYDAVAEEQVVENVSAEEVVPETQEWVDESVSSPSEEPAELDELSSYAESTENNFPDSYDEVAEEQVVENVLSSNDLPVESEGVSSLAESVENGVSDSQNSVAEEVVSVPFAEGNVVETQDEESEEKGDTEEPKVVSDAVVLESVPSEILIEERTEDNKIIQDNAPEIVYEEDVSSNVESSESVSEDAIQESAEIVEDESQVSSLSDTVCDEVKTEIKIAAEHDCWSSLPLSELSENPKIINQYSGVETWAGDKYQQDLKLVVNQASDLDKWTCLIFHRYSVKLSSGVSEVFIEKPENVVRYASLVQNGIEKLKIFNQDRYKFVIPQNELFSVQGNVICGRIDDTVSLDIQDYLSVSLHLFANQVIHFKSPASGILIGPQGNKIYFAEAQNFAVVSEEQVVEEDFFEYLPPLQGIDNRNCFVFGDDSEETEFLGKENQTHLVVNVGTTLYGWNIRFDDESYMSLRDALEYQSRYKKIPSANGELIHGTKVLKFYGVEHLQARQKAVYYSYGRI